MKRASLHGISRCWVYFEFRFMQIVVNNSSSMKPVNVLNNFYTEILLFSPLKVLAHREGMAKDLASFS